MSSAAARIGDMHSCPLVSGATPHIGGPIVGPGVPNVIIGGLPAVVVGNFCACNGPTDTIIGGSATVFIEGRPAARMGDHTAHGGTIVSGEPTVLIGG